MVKGLTTVCRTAAIIAVWASSATFLTFGLPSIRLHSVGADVAVFFYLSAIFVAVGGAVISTGVLWLTGRKRKPTPSAERAFAVLPPSD